MLFNERGWAETPPAGISPFLEEIPLSVQLSALAIRKASARANLAG
jgi:hypothetical protein